MTNKINALHVPVLATETLGHLAPKSGDSYLDLTAGYGGHASLVYERTKTRMTLVDRDQMAIDHLSERFTKEQAEIINSDFLDASRKLVQDGRTFDIILADLGVSSVHLNIASRGFAIQQDGPLDMRMNQTQDLTAEQVVNTYAESDLVRVLRDYGEEPRAYTIARAIIAARPLVSTAQLAKIIASTFKGYSKTHPATRTFQALRIEVNDELRQVAKALPLWIKLLNPGGRVAIISFHSLEDRIVKNALAERAGNKYDAELQLLTKRPVVAGKDELVSNPRARSAKLRVAVKIKTKKERG
ncbi:16S rRNA (cytosine(1402)-N(4))-methyltransferase RsmH [Candidatus Saccharibacteria bacterium]|nr:16S rRNA (cytosine(1402)-N(4))-methyltransferase RsmH [Candidatus Saccharibacteria bacterium]